MSYGDITGFFFQPPKVDMKDADIYGNNGFLEKYWNQDPIKLPKNDKPLFGAGSYFNSDFDVYFPDNSGCGYSYDEVTDELDDKLGKLNPKTQNIAEPDIPYCSGPGTSYILQQQDEPYTVAHYNKYFDSVFDN